MDIVIEVTQANVFDGEVFCGIVERLPKEPAQMEWTALDTDSHLVVLSQVARETPDPGDAAAELVAHHRRQKPTPWSGPDANLVADIEAWKKS